MERRRHYRYQVSLPVRIALPASKTRVPGRHRVANLSRGGLLVEARNHDLVLHSERTGLSPGGDVLLEVILPTSRYRLRARARVVRCSSKVFHDRLALSIVEADSGYRTLIRDLALRRYERVAHRVRQLARIRQPPPARAA